jgi:aromatic ring-opening dioxygenase catalytic subunit (LigB family)
MASIVGAIGVPHNPNFPALIAREGPDCETARLFAELRAELTALKPDLIVMFDTDHLNTFFLDNLPIFGVGVANEFSGPNDDVPAMKRYTAPSHAAFANHLLAAVVRADFDPTLVQDFEVDHSVSVPLNFLTPDLRVPTIPIFINGHVPPLPKAARCFALGEAVRRGVESWPEPLRVVVIGSGSFSLDVHGTKTNPGQPSGVPAPEWAARIQRHLEHNRFSDLIAESTQEQMLRAGNVGGELLNWIAMLGTVNGHALQWIKPEVKHGHAYAVWK